jgi:hypothetical protein
MPGRGMASNIQLLTHSHKVVKEKKRHKREQVKPLVFDEDARRCAYITLSHPPAKMHETLLQGISDRLPQTQVGQKRGEQEEGTGKGEARAS